MSRVAYYLRKWYPLTPRKEEDMLLHFYGLCTRKEKAKLNVLDTLVAIKIARRVLDMSAREAKNRQRIFARMRQVSNAIAALPSGPPMKISFNELDSYRFISPVSRATKRNSDQTIAQLMSMDQTRLLIKELLAPKLSLIKAKQMVAAHTKSLGFESLAGLIDYVHAPINVSLESIGPEQAIDLEQTIEQIGEADRQVVAQFQDELDAALERHGLDGLRPIIDKVHFDLHLSDAYLIEYYGDEKLLEKEFNVKALPNIDEVIKQLKTINAESGEEALKLAVKMAETMQQEYAAAIETIFAAALNKRAIEREIAMDIRLNAESNRAETNRVLDEAKATFAANRTALLKLITCYIYAPESSEVRQIVLEAHQRCFIGFSSAGDLWEFVQDAVATSQPGTFRKILIEFMRCALREAGLELA